MGKIELKKTANFMYEKDENEKEEYLQELGKAVHHFVRTGHRTKQLEEFVKQEEKFRERYQKYFNIDFLIGSDLEERYLIEIDIQDQETANRRNLEFFTKTEKCIRENDAKEIRRELTEKINARFQDTVYLSHINMLYELYEREEKLRREEKEYEKISEQFQSMAKAAQILSQKKRMELEELQIEEDISRQEMEKMLSGCNKYFNVRPKKQGVEISLSPAGRKYYHYMENSSPAYSKEAYNELLRKNTDNVISALEKSYDRGIAVELSLEEILPETERMIRHRYHKLTKRFMAEGSDDYLMNSDVGNSKKERVKADERISFRIKEEW